MKKWLIALVPLLILLGFIGYRLEQKQAATAAQAKMRQARTNAPVSVEYATAQDRDIMHTFEVIGSVEPILSVNVTPKVTGSIQYLQAREGDRVSRGQTLVRIDPTALQASVRQQQANLAEAKYRLAQAQLTQSTTNSSVTTQISQMKAGLASAKADLRQQEVARDAQLESIKSTLLDAESKVDSANAAVENARANIKSAQANLNNATVKYKRTNSLYTQGFIDAQSVDDARTAVSVQQATLDTANGQLKSSQAALNSAKAQQGETIQQTNITRASADSSLDNAKAKLTQAKAALEYAMANKPQAQAYQQNLEALKAAVSVARASLDSAIANLADATLVSPLDGVVTARNQDPGGLATPGQAILTLQATNQVWVNLAVPENVAAKIRLQQPVSVAFDALGGQKSTATIAQINPSASAQGRQYTVRLLLDNSDSRLRSGMFAHVTLVTDHVHGLAVPLEAIQHNDQGSYVIVPGKDSKAVFQPVQTGASDAKWVAVTGLESGAKVVTMSATTVREGSTIGAGKHGKKGPGGSDAHAPGGADAHAPTADGTAPAAAGSTPPAAGPARPAEGH